HHFHTDHPVFSCSKIEQKQLNTWVSFQSAEQPLLGQFSVSGNSPVVTTLERLAEFFEAEEYHQDFFTKNPSNRYCQISISPKLAKLEKIIKK
ncbi:peptide-methionine (S)-S-oxide reductase, partial [Pseudomonas sp. MF6394]